MLLVNVEINRLINAEVELFIHCKKKKCFSYLVFFSCFQSKYQKILKSR